MRHSIKRIITASRPLLRLLNRISGNLPKIFVYHRFAPAGISIPHRVNVDSFAWQLDTINRDFEIITFGECIERFLRNRQWPRGCAVLTVDDGYHDMYEYAWPELKKRNLVATFFVTTGFVNGDLWLWPDRLKFALSETLRSCCNVNMGRNVVSINLKDRASIEKTWKIFSDYCISIADNDRLTFINQVEEALAVIPPAVPTPDFSPVSWSQLIDMQASGIEIGGHTITHPILSKTEIDALDREVRVCRHILQQKLSLEINSFCYPNGMSGDINDAVVAAVELAGFRGAVLCTVLDGWDRYRVPRVGVSDDKADFLWKLYGGENLAYKLSNRC